MVDEKDLKIQDELFQLLLKFAEKVTLNPPFKEMERDAKDLADQITRKLKVRFELRTKLGPHVREVGGSIEATGLDQEEKE